MRATAVVTFGCASVPGTTSRRSRLCKTTRQVEHVIEFVTDPSGVILTTSGSADVAGFERMNAELLGDPRFVPGTPILVDHSDLDTRTLSTDDAVEIGRSVERLQSRLGPSPVAIVVADPHAFDRAGESIPDGPSTQLEVRVFYALRDGVDWLQSGSSAR
jgi:hypothetical protein